MEDRKGEWAIKLVCKVFAKSSGKIKPAQVFCLSLKRQGAEPTEASLAKPPQTSGTKGFRPIVEGDPLNNHTAICFHKGPAIKNDMLHEVTPEGRATNRRLRTARPSSNASRQLAKRRGGRFGETWRRAA